MENRVKEIVTINENVSTYTKLKKIFTANPNVIIFEKYTLYKQTGNKTSEIKRIENGQMVSRNSRTIVYRN